MTFRKSDIVGAASYYLREYAAAVLTFFFVPICFYLDAGSTRIFQNTLGVGAWLCLLVLLSGETRLVRLQVGVAIAFATIGEHFASVYMEGYIYRLQNVPAFVPPGHGLVYLTAVVLARSDLFNRWKGQITVFVLLIASAWSTWGLVFADRNDVVGFVLFLVFVFCVFTGPSPRLYLGAFFITSWLELVGTHLDTWGWVPIDPASGLPQGNPPSGVAAWYCLVDAVAIGGAPVMMSWIDKIQSKCRFVVVANHIRSSHVPASLTWYMDHAKFPILALIIFL